MASDAVTLIKADHRVLAALLEQLEDPSSDRVALLEEVGARLTAHTRAEEDQVYPALIRADPDETDQIDDATDEHREVEGKLQLLQATDPDSVEFEYALRDFVDSVNHHVEQEESELLPGLEDTVDRATLEALGAAFDARRIEELQAYGIEDDMLAAAEEPG